MTERMYKRNLGRKGEEISIDFLQRKGYEILKRNYRYGHKEIDVVARDKNTIVFVEVKTGRSKKFGEPFEKVNATKQKTLIEVAKAFIQENEIKGCDFRFDVISVDLKGDEKIEHIKNAFMAE
jgi:putative endonuclease